MKNLWTAIAFFFGVIITAALLVDYSNLGFGNNSMQYILIIGAIIGIIGVLLASIMRDNKRILLAKVVLILTVLLLLVELFLKIFLSDILDVSYLSLLAAMGIIVAMVMTIRQHQKQTTH
ncbi:MAG: hypothetical protein FWH23_06420 [Bacteroidales bacterium]|nr:hypothetical protein [Bacteroidales bacterium]